MYKAAKKEAKKVLNDAKYITMMTHIIGWEQEKERRIFVSLQK